jgi:hypothetical protein
MQFEPDLSKELKPFSNLLTGPVVDLSLFLCTGHLFMVEQRLDLLPYASFQLNQILQRTYIPLNEGQFLVQDSKVLSEVEIFIP